jgi:hypothetical protein
MTADEIRKVLFQDFRKQQIRLAKGTAIQKEYEIMAQKLK